MLQEDCLERPRGSLKLLGKCHGPRLACVTQGQCEALGVRINPEIETSGLRSTNTTKKIHFQEYVFRLRMIRINEV